MECSDQGDRIPPFQKRAATRGNSLEERAEPVEQGVPRRDVDPFAGADFFIDTEQIGPALFLPIENPKFAILFVAERAQEEVGAWGHILKAPSQSRGDRREMCAWIVGTSLKRIELEILRTQDDQIESFALEPWQLCQQASLE